MLSAHLCVPVSAKPALRVCEFVRLDLISSLIHGCGSMAADRRIPAPRDLCSAIIKACDDA
jgi:hypothetical protein